MRINYLLPIATILFLSLFSCIQEPTACISESNIEINVDEPFKLTNCSEDAESYEWNMGGGTILTTEDINYSFDKAGTYTLILKAVSKKDKKTSSEFVTIDVTETDKQKVSGTQQTRNTKSWTWVSHQSKFYSQSDPSLVYSDETNTSFEEQDKIVFRNDGTGEFTVFGNSSKNMRWELKEDNQIELALDGSKGSPYDLYEIIGLTTNRIEIYRKFISPWDDEANEFTYVLEAK